MKERASLTAEWVAGCRSLGILLPEAARLADDPYGIRFAPSMRPLMRMPAFPRAFLRRFILYMQVRTRVIDDALLAFLEAPGDGREPTSSGAWGRSPHHRGAGAQVVILGAGFDCRALRFAHELAHATVFEVDHPATQARKREVLKGDVGAHTEYLAWDFEKRDPSELPSALAERGHDATRPTLTIWEGVTMYLSEQAIDACVRAVGAYSAPRSPFVLTYFDRAFLEHPDGVERIARRFVARMGEPFRFGWDASELRGWMRARGFVVERDASMIELARGLLPQRFALGSNATGRRIAMTTKT